VEFGLQLLKKDPSISFQKFINFAAMLSTDELIASFHSKIFRTLLQDVDFEAFSFNFSQNLSSLYFDHVFEFVFNVISLIKKN
jgi:hypothetical protein